MSISAPMPDFNPWTSIWTRPRATIQRIVETDPRAYVLPLAAIAGVVNALSSASENGFGDSMAWPTILITAALLGSALGIASLYVGSVLLRWTGRWLGGQGSGEQIRAAAAWASVPLIVVLLLWIPMIALFGQELFMTPTPDMSPSLALPVLGLGLAQMVLGIWSLVIFLKALGQVQGFSAWRALGNMVLAALVIVVPLMLVTVVLIRSTS